MTSAIVWVLAICSSHVECRLEEHLRYLTQAECKLAADAINGVKRSSYLYADCLKREEIKQ